MILVYWLLGVLPFLFGLTTVLDGIAELLWFDSRRREGSSAWWWIATEKAHPFKRLGSKVGLRLGVAEKTGIGLTEIVIGFCLMSLGAIFIGASLDLLP